MTELRGIPASPGIAQGRVLLISNEQDEIPHYAISQDMVEQEQLRYDEAVSRAKSEIEDIRQRSQTSPKPLGASELQMLDTHLLMLSDPDMGNQVLSGLSEKLLNVEFVLFEITQKLVAKLSSVEDDYLRERSADLHDVSRRIIGNLLSRERVNLSRLEEDVIVVCNDLLPSDAIAMDKDKVKGIVMNAGGRTSHTAILARAFEIPAVLGLGSAGERIGKQDFLIVDGTSGTVFVNPDQSTRREYTDKFNDVRQKEIQLLGLNDEPAESRDGKAFKLLANIEIPEEVDAARSHGADGIGLYRSEFLFLRSNTLPDEQEQFEAYSRVLSEMNPRPVTIRTLDIGGDKLMSNIPSIGSTEKNPILGWRAIRYCLSHVEIFRTQLRALLRASAFGNLRIMFPLISGVQELKQALIMLEAIKLELQHEKIAYQPDIPAGIMIEVPSAAMTTDLLARYSSFFSIGTNDLIQYTLAVDRGNEHVAYLYDPLHPGILRTLRMIIDQAHAAGLSVGMCGEMAGDPLYSLLLMGLGLDEFSMSSFGIPRIKQIIRCASMQEAQDFVGRVMDIENPETIGDFVADFMEDRFDLSG